MMQLLSITILAVFGEVFSGSVQPTYCPNEFVKRRLFDKVMSTPAPQELIDFGENEFQQQRIDVDNNVYFYIGYGLSNVIVLDAPDGLIIVDALDSGAAINPILDDIEENISQKKVKALLYTHDHPDHVGGAMAVQARQPNDPVEVWAYSTLQSEFWEKWQYNRPFLLIKGFRQVGADLQKNAFINAGVGPRFVLDATAGLLTVPPTNLFEGEELDVNIAGLDMQFVYIPGETRDHMGVYIPSKRMFLPGDDMYKAFPNLYAIRGTPPRPVLEWMGSIDKIRGLDIEILLPSHSLPIFGSTEVQNTLETYRDAIQYVHDQTTRLLNRGLHTDEIAQMVQLPDSIRDNPYTRELYGTVEWGSKAVTESRMGWFSGFPDELLPLSPKDEASYWGELLNYPKSIMNIKRSIRRGTEKDLRWAVKLSSVLWNNRENMVSFRIQEVLSLRSEALRLLASIQLSPNARNYILRWVLEENCNQSNAAFTDTGTITVLPPGNLVYKMAVMLKAELLDGVRDTVVLNFIDIGFTNTLEIRNNIMEILDEEVNTYTIHIDVNLSDFRNVLLGAATLESVGAQVFPDYEEGDRFMSYFDDPNANYF